MIVSVINVYSGSERVFSGNVISVEAQLRLVWGAELCRIPAGDFNSVVSALSRIQIYVVRVTEEEGCSCSTS